MYSYYPTLVEAVIEFKTYHRKIIAKNNGKHYYIQPEHETTFFSSTHFRLLKDPISQKIWCCLHDQSILQRIDEKSC